MSAQQLTLPHVEALSRLASEEVAAAARARVDDPYPRLTAAQRLKESSDNGTFTDAPS